MHDERARPFRRATIYAAAWLPFFTIYLAAFIANRVPLGYAARNAVANVLPDALLGLAVIRLPRRISWPDERRARFFVSHAALLALFVAASTAGWLILAGLDSLAFEGALHWKISSRIIPFRVLNDGLIYCALAGVSYAWHNAAAGREQVVRANRAEALRARAELQAMRSQLNPHFILNTLHALLRLVRREPVIAEDALERLGDLLRYGLRIHREGIDDVALRDEAAFVRSYLDLEHLRLGDRLRVSFDVPETSLDCVLPAFSLQTLVENAVRHAIAPRPEGGMLAVRAVCADGRLRVTVEDDGPGFSAPAGEAGLGLRLLRERLAALHGNRAGVELAPRPGGGTRARLDVPARRTAGED